MMTITVENLQKKIPINPARIKGSARKILERERVRGGTLSITFVSDQKIKALNKKYLKREYITDVLAFDLRGKSAGCLPMAGEIVISADTAFKNSAAFGNSLEKEILLYVIHGILHLSGYDDHAIADIKRMRAREQFHLKALKL